MVDQLVLFVVLEDTYTHAHFARFPDATGLWECMERRVHLALAEKLDDTTPGRIVVDHGS